MNNMGVTSCRLRCTDETLARAIPRRKVFAMAASVAFAIVAIPALAFVLRLTHIFEKFLM